MKIYENDRSEKDESIWYSLTEDKVDADAFVSCYKIIKNVKVKYYLWKSVKKGKTYTRVIVRTLNNDMKTQLNNMGYSLFNPITFDDI